MTHRRRHVDAIKDELRKAGATAIETARHHDRIRIAYILLGQAHTMCVDAHPRDPVVATNTGRQLARRASRAFYEGRVQ